jgi:DNA polymerase-3 subunit gamma/tau
MFGVVVKYRAKVAEAPEPKVSAPVIEPTAPEEFTEEADYEEPIAPTVSEPEEKAGEFMLREVLGAEPIKGEN